MIVQNIDIDIPDNTALPHIRQITLQTTELISREIEKWKGSEMHLKSFSSLSGHAVAQLVEALPYKSEGRGFDSRWCHWNFSLT